MSGIETARPSGKFWMPIPSASVAAEPNVAPGVLPMAPNATPTAMPSGKLWIVMARMRRRRRRSCDTRSPRVATASLLAPSPLSSATATLLYRSSSSSEPCILESHQSVPWRSAPPERKPSATGTYEKSPQPWSSANSSAGASNDQYDAAIITPPLTPSMKSSTLRYAVSDRPRWWTATPAAPRAVMNQPNDVPRKARRTGCQLRTELNKPGGMDGAEGHVEQPPPPPRRRHQILDASLVPGLRHCCWGRAGACGPEEHPASLSSSARQRQSR
mmetsp:Transcript_41616/g.109785  ORF Transcript_41616/g.109785 Transcript_41616/m.109785 type:complete len:273 (+) Transcript_41616:774-1592(+)